MSRNSFVDVRIRVISIGEKNGQRFLRTDALPEELEPYCSHLDVQRLEGSVLHMHLYYEPFLGFVDAVEGDSVLFRFDLSNTKLVFAPTPELYLGDPRIPLALAPSLVHRFYKLSEQADDPSLYWCTGLDSQKKKQKAILLDVSRLCSLSLSILKEPSPTSEEASSLFSTVKISKLLVAIPHRANLSPRAVSPSSSSSEDEVPLSPSKNTPSSKAKKITARIKHRINRYDEDMLNISPLDPGSVV